MRKISFIILFISLGCSSKKRIIIEEGKLYNDLLEKENTKEFVYENTDTYYRLKTDTSIIVPHQFITYNDTLVDAIKLDTVRIKFTEQGCYLYRLYRNTGECLYYLPNISFKKDTINVYDTQAEYASVEINNKDTTVNHIACAQKNIVNLEIFVDRNKLSRARFVKFRSHVFKVR